jgi:CDP-paratose 2-epimerase
MLEAIAALEELHGRKLDAHYVDENRRGDHICYISNLGRFRRDYPEWELTISLEEIYEQLARIPAPLA